MIHRPHVPRPAAAALTAAVLFASTHCQAAQTFMEEKLPYAQARTLLLERGFKPYVMPGSDACDGDNPRCYPELERCVQKRHWICNYAWRSGKTIYHLETRAEVPVVDSFYCLLNCGKEEQQATGPSAEPAKIN